MKERLRDRLLRRGRPLDPRAQLGLFRRLAPIGRDFGFSRGLPIDRHYVERHISRHAADVAGRVLEAGGGVQYGRTFGGDRVAHLDIMYPHPGFADQTLVADLVTGEGLPLDSYDCLIMAQVFNYIYDVRAAVENARRALRPGGVLLATLSGISQMSPGDVETWGDYWRFTPMSATRLFGDAFRPENVEVGASGNVYVACAFLQCLATGDLTARELEHDDPDYPFSIAVRAVRAR